MTTTKGSSIIFFLLEDEDGEEKTHFINLVFFSNTKLPK